MLVKGATDINFTNFIFPLQSDPLLQQEDALRLLQVVQQIFDFYLTLSLSNNMWLITHVSIQFFIHIFTAA